MTLEEVGYELTWMMKYVLGWRAVTNTITPTSQWTELHSRPHQALCSVESVLKFSPSPSGVWDQLRPAIPFRRDTQILHWQCGPAPDLTSPLQGTFPTTTLNHSSHEFNQITQDYETHICGLVLGPCHCPSPRRGAWQMACSCWPMHGFFNKIVWDRATKIGPIFSDSNVYIERSPLKTIWLRLTPSNPWWYSLLGMAWGVMMGTGKAIRAEKQFWGNGESGWKLPLA